MTSFTPQFLKLARHFLERKDFINKLNECLLVFDLSLSKNNKKKRDVFHLRNRYESTNRSKMEIKEKSHSTNLIKEELLLLTKKMEATFKENQTDIVSYNWLFNLHWHKEKLLLS